MDLNFASFRPICVGKNSTWHPWSMKDGAVSVQVQKHNQHVTVEQWEPRAAVVTSSNFSSCMSQKDKGGNQRSLKTSRRKFMENSEIRCMRKTGKKINVWNGVYIYHHLPREEVPTVISQCEKMFHRVLRPAKLWKRTFQIDSWTGSKKSVSKTMMTSFSCNKVLAETHESLRSTGCIGSSFWLQISHHFAFPLSSEFRAKGCASGPMDVTSVALQFRERRGLCRSVCGKRGRWK